MKSWDADQPIYLQLREQAIGMILDGTLGEGEPLPSVRKVAQDYRLNPLTVSRAYQGLVDEGVVESRRGLGMFVRSGARDALKESEKQKFLDEEWPVVREKAARLGIDLRQLIELEQGETSWER